jgi:genome maintenance exonuclease 1
MFTFIDKFRNAFKEIQRKLVEGTRYYIIDDEEVAYPSITSIISHVNRKKWADWQQKVGLQEANRVRNHSTRRGNGFHKVAEVYIQNGKWKELQEYKDPLIQLMFGAAKTHIDKRFSNIVYQEQQMYTHKFGVAGTVDLVCDVDGELSIVDFKTSKAEKPEEWLEDYFVQLSAYWAMFSERTGVVPKKLVVFLVGENGDVQIVERRNIMDYLKTLQDYVNQFIQHRDAYTQRH